MAAVLNCWSLLSWVVCVRFFPLSSIQLFRTNESLAAFLLYRAIMIWTTTILLIVWSLSYFLQFSLFTASFLPVYSTLKQKKNWDWKTQNSCAYIRKFIHICNKNRFFRFCFIYAVCQLKIGSSSSSKRRTRLYSCCLKPSLHSTNTINSWIFRALYACVYCSFHRTLTRSNHTFFALIDDNSYPTELYGMVFFLKWNCSKHICQDEMATTNIDIFNITTKHLLFQSQYNWD